jgi:pilus assembly protein CpaB
MNRNKLLLIGVVALALAGLLTFVAYRSSLGKLAALRAGHTLVVLAAKDLQVGEMLEADDVRVAELPASEVPAGAFHNRRDVLGHGVIAVVAKNEVLLPSKVATDKASAGLPALIPANMRAVSVRVNDVVAVAGFVTPGTRVDVLVTGNPSTNAETVTTTVLENVEVLAAGQKMQANSEGRPENVTVITLLVSPEDAQKLTLASADGKIQLALRNPMDSKKPSASPINKDQLYRVSAPAAPVPPKPRLIVARKSGPAPLPARVVEVYRGAKVEVTEVRQ